MNDDLNSLLTWRKGVLPTLAKVPLLEQEVAKLRKEVAKLKTPAKAAEAKTAPVVRPERFASTEELELAFSAAFGEVQQEGGGQWLSLADIVKKIGLKTTSRAVGHLLSRGLGLESTVRRSGNKTHRAYYLKIL